MLSFSSPMPEFSGLAEVRTNKIWVELFSADIWSKTNLYAAATPYSYFLDRLCPGEWHVSFELYDACA